MRTDWLFHPYSSTGADKRWICENSNPIIESKSSVLIAEIHTFNRIVTSGSNVLWVFRFLGGQTESSAS